MVAQQDEVFQETCETMFRLNQDEKVRYWCEAREEAERIALTIEQDHAKQLAERDAIIAEKDSAIAEKDSAIAELNAQIVLLKAQLQQQK